MDKDARKIRYESSLDWLLASNMILKCDLTERNLSPIDYSEILLDKNEIDFLIKLDGDIIPIEVKSGRRTNSKCLNEYIKKYSPKYSIRLSLKNFGFENNIKSVPLYATFCIKSNNK